MGQIDDFIALDSDHPFVRRTVNGSTSGRRVGSGINSSHGSTNRPWDWRSWIDSYTSGDYLNITDRSQIINPEQILAQGNWNNSADSIAEYNKALQALRNIQAQQEAAFAEYYNSPINQVQRDQVAGLNPDILGLSGSQAAQAGVGESQPYSGLPTSEELAFQKQQIRNQQVANVLSSIATVANLANAFSGLAVLPNQVKLLKNQADLTSSQSDASLLQNLSSFENLVGTEISSRLSDSISSSLSNGLSLDINEWFSDEKNFENLFESYAPSDLPAYRNAFSNVRKRMQSSLGRAYSQGKVTAENQGSFSALVADPTYSADQLIQIAQLRPYMEARRDLEKARNEYETKLSEWNTKYQDALSVRDAVDVANAKNEYDAEYYSSMDAEKMALYDSYIKQAEGIRSRMRFKIDSNLMEVYEAHPYDIKGFGAAYAYDNAGLTWYEYLGSHMVAYGLESDYSLELFDKNGTPVIQGKDGKFYPMGAPSDSPSSPLGLGSFK